MTDKFDEHINTAQIYIRRNLSYLQDMIEKKLHFTSQGPVTTIHKEIIPGTHQWR
jgi:hypothetical protein